MRLFVVFAMLLAISAGAQSSFRDEGLNVDYTPPAGWTLGPRLVVENGVSFQPEKAGRTSPLISFLVFRDTTERDLYLFKRLFGTARASFNNSDAAPTISSLYDLSDNSVRLFGIEVVGDAEVWAATIQYNRNYLFEIVFPVAVANWNANRAEYLSHFGSMDFIQLNKNAPAKITAAPSATQSEAKAKFMVDLLGRKKPIRNPIIYPKSDNYPVFTR